jgi:hypothetical protein
METYDSRLLMGTCQTLQDAIDYVQIKESLDQWKCLIRPFPFEFTRIKKQQIGMPDTTIVLPCGWAFVLHHFYRN